MKLTTLESVFRALNESGVRYLLVGGLAVNAHGYEQSRRMLTSGCAPKHDDLFSVITVGEGS